MGLQLSGSVQLEGNLLVTGSSNSVFENLLVSGKIVSQEIETQFVSSSIIYSSGSNKFGDSADDTHQFTGSVSVTGSLMVNGVSAIVGTGTTNFLAKFTGSGAIGNSLIFDNGNNVGIGGVTNPPVGLTVRHPNHGVGIDYIGLSPFPSIAGIFTAPSVGAGSQVPGGGGFGYGDLLIKSRSDFSGYNILFYTAASNNTPLERMRITSGGNVNIGGNYTSTNNTLQITGNVAIGTTTAAPTNGLTVGGDIRSPSSFRSYTGSLVVPTSTFTTVYTFNNTDNMSGIFTVHFEFTNASLICFFTKTWDGGITRLTVGSTVDRENAAVQVINENAIQVIHQTGVNVTANWSITRVS